MTKALRSTCSVKAEYKVLDWVDNHRSEEGAKGGGNDAGYSKIAWVVFEGKLSLNKHYCQIDTDYANEDKWVDFYIPPMNVGEEYNYWVYGQVMTDDGEFPDFPGVDGYPKGTEEISKGGRECILFEKDRTWPGAGFRAQIKVPEGRGLFLTKSDNEKPGTFLACDGGTTPPDPGNPDPDPGPDPDPPTPTPPPEPCNGECPPGTNCIAAENRCEWVIVERNIIPACLQFQCCQNKCEEGRPDGNINIGDGDGDGLGDCDKRPTPEPVPGSNNRNQTYLYDRLNHTFVFCCPIHADVTWLLPFDTMPPVFQRYVTTTASVRVAAQMINNPQLFQLLKDRENTLRMECMNYEMEQADLNFLNQPDHSTYMSYQTMQTLNR